MECELHIITNEEANPEIIIPISGYVYTHEGVDENGISGKIYPNPAIDMLLLASQESGIIEILSVSDVLGNIYKPEIAYSTDRIILNLEGFNSGLYFINYRMAGEIRTASFIIAR